LIRTVTLQSYIVKPPKQLGIYAKVQRQQESRADAHEEQMLEGRSGDRSGVLQMAENVRSEIW
jgi:hypothetical protein